MYYFSTRRVFLFLFLCFSSLSLFAQTVKVETGEYQMRLEIRMSEKEANDLCIEQAKIDAIEKAFGKAIVQNNSTFIQNKGTGEKTETQNVFNFLSETYVNGEWIGDVEAPVINKTLINDEIWITAKVKGKIRELKTSKVSFDAKTASCTENNCVTETFKDGQNFYLFFKAPVDGFLAVYLDAPSDKKTYKLLPYKQSTSETSFPIKADKEYVFFSPAHSQTKTADELQMTLTDVGVPETDKLFILFSPETPLEKPILEYNAKTNAQKQVISENYALPPFLNSEEFQKWQQKLRLANSKIQFQTYFISIKP